MVFCGVNWWFQRFFVWVQSWKIWNRVSSSDLQNEERDCDTISNLNNILFKNKILFNSLYWNTCILLSTVAMFAKNANQNNVEK